MTHFYYSIKTMEKKIYWKKFGRRVREICQKKNISQEKLAFKVEMHRTYIGGIERGERNVSLINIIKIAKALDVESGEFFEIMD